ncbi:MAG TPA: alpha/beta hydrolase [Dyella sp.]|uniref:alpha/beta fold hydrolase n=1 Tax=Dyella sp. TaxID=1869338 RepID=UPI002F95865D
MASQTTNVVLVHGAWADESGWEKVARQLRSNGLNVVTASLPLSSLADDTAALDRQLEDLSGPVVLAGHAYAGAVIGTIRHPRVRALVYIAGLAPAEGETVADVFYRYEQDPRAPRLAPGADGLIRLPPEAIATAFTQDATPEEQAVLAAGQAPISPLCITVPVGRPRWLDVPAWYLLAEQDRMIPAKTQRFMAERMQAHIRALPVDHLPNVTAPAAVTALILDAVAQTGG